jgi:hypothetical protein
MIEDIQDVESKDKKQSQDETIKKIKKQNPGIKVKKVKGGGFQISNPRAPNKLLLELIKRVT